MIRRRMPFSFAFALAVASGCGSGPGAPSAPSRGAPAASSRGAPADDGVCAERDALFDGGAMLRAEDGISLWYKAAGNASGPTLVYVHGGPCFGSLDFEKSAGPALERSARVVYFDQRGCGRSAAGGTEANLTMAANVEDLERLRRHFGLERLNLVAHSAGGWVAVEYAKRHPERVGRLVLVDTSGAFQRSVQYRLDYAASIAPKAFPEHEARARELAGRGRDAKPEGRMEAFEALATLLGPAWSRHLYVANDREAQSLEKWPAELRRHCGAAFGASLYTSPGGYLFSDNPGLMTPLPARAMLLAGRQSHVFGPALLEEAARAWRVELRWLEGAGHFAYAAQPDAFAEAVLAFVAAG